MKRRIFSLELFLSFVIFSRSHLLFPRLPHHPRAPSNCPASRHHDHQDGDDADAQDGDDADAQDGDAQDGDEADAKDADAQDADDQDGDDADAHDGDSTFPPVS